MLFFEGPCCSAPSPTVWNRCKTGQHLPLVGSSLSKTLGHRFLVWPVTRGSIHWGSQPPHPGNSGGTREGTRGGTRLPQIRSREHRRKIRFLPPRELLTPEPLLHPRGVLMQSPAAHAEHAAAGPHEGPRGTVPPGASRGVHEGYIGAMSTDPFLILRDSPRLDLKDAGRL